MNELVGLVIAFSFMTIPIAGFSYLAARRERLTAQRILRLVKERKSQGFTAQLASKYTNKGRIW